jgi:tRNA threonylcarbamoyladenosine biosynthesis protein TsaE
MQIVSHSVDDTFALGRRMGRAAQPGQVLALVGPLGAGKTHLVRGIAEGARVADPDLVSSPTYVILNIYPANPALSGSKPVYHLDAYRTTGADGFAAVGFDELLAEEGIVALEWADRVPDLLPPDYLQIAVDAPDEATRVFTCTATGPQSRALLKTLESAP